MARRKITIKDVALEADVSVASVSLYLNNKPGLADETRQRIGETITKLGYVPRRTNATPNEASFIGLLVEKMMLSAFFDMFYGEVIQGMEYRARKLGYNIALMQIEPDGELPRLLAEHPGNLAGLVMLGGGGINREVVSQVLQEELPAILVDNAIPDIEIDAVMPDYVSGAYQVVRYLIEQGYRHIACIRGPGKYQSLVQRFRGYCCALIEAGLPLEPDLIQPSLSAGTPNKGYRETKALLERGQPIDAIFCVSDRTAFGTLQALKEANLRIPDDIAVVGFDNVAQSGHTVPPLTTVDVPKQAMGEIAIQRLYSLMTEPIAMPPVQNLLYTSLVVRDST
ncbi:MAG: LacI family DNA-binding transcriptional regulator [Anaerolineae bacterium]|nr:LacI family DNA-binding transcriptional regulator [Anaerolineae bacterium]